MPTRDDPPAPKVNLVTKSGTNKWHASASEFYRSRGFTANDWFNNHTTDVNGNSAPVPRTPLQRNTFGVGIGGPIIKNKVFFFYSYEGRRDASSLSQTQVVPLSNLGQGLINYTYCADANSNSILQNTVDASSIFTTGLNPAALSALAQAAQQFPTNDTSQGDGLNTGGFRCSDSNKAQFACCEVRLQSHKQSDWPSFAST